ncbi:hypothetical protein V7127_20495 [Bacillus sp. JJ1773]|uniref:hypothetical protein n=1 Tax=Bacillus sp. JJ1773 TaxID=3122965 RepID=UPI002FFDFEE6
MKRILDAKNVNGTTRFYFDTNIGIKTFIKLLGEFKDESNHITMSKNSISAKLILRKKAIELNRNYISFFPKIENSQEVEEVRERIYKHVAKKADVYKRSASENEELSITSLIKGDLRACASLLYYCLHKSISSLMYSFFNETMRLDDEKIEITEVEHFTSSSYYSYFTKGLPIEEINKNNYLQVIKKRVKPFKLLRYIIKEDQLNKVKLIINPYLDFLSKKLFDLEINDPKLAEHLDCKISEFISSKEKKQPEEEVEAAIASALYKYIENGQDYTHALLLFDILSLRLYWLRQTADYAYDFEVKTSYREMSLILSAVQGLIKLDLEDDERSTENKELIKNGESTSENGEFKNNLKINNVIENISFEPKEVQFFNVAIKFPEEIKVDKDNILAFLTSIHIDSTFDKDVILEILNLNESIRNEGKYFIYENKNPISNPLYVYINDDGRWTVWYQKTETNKNFLTASDLTQSFQDLIATIKDNLYEFFDDNYQINLVAAYPVFMNRIKKLNATSILEVKNAIDNKIKILQTEVTRGIVKQLNLNMVSANSFRIHNLDVKVKLIFNLNNRDSSIPWKSLVLNKINKTKDPNAYLSIIVDDNNIEDNVNDLLFVSQSIRSQLGFDNIIEGNDIVHITSEQLDEFIYDENKDSSIFEGLASIINEVVYERIGRGQIGETEKLLLEKSHEIWEDYSYPIATLGTWHFRYQDMDKSICLEKGKEYYTRAIELEKNKGNLEDALNIQQKFHFELAKFFMERDVNLVLAEENISQGLEIGEEQVFYDDLLKLKEILVVAQTSLAQTAGSIEKNNDFHDLNEDK